MDQDKVIVDTSIIIAWIKDEPSADWIARVLPRQSGSFKMSWANIVEAAMVLRKEHTAAADLIESAINELHIEPLESDFEITRLVAEARQRFPLNFGDCFAYAHAKRLAEPLITLDSDFLKTDLPRVLHPDQAI